MVRERLESVKEEIIKVAPLTPEGNHSLIWPLGNEISVTGLTIYSGTVILCRKLTQLFTVQRFSLTFCRYVDYLLICWSISGDA